MSEYKCTSVVEYLERLENLGEKNLLYRGESKLYDEPLLATAFRGYNKTHEEMQKIFYNETINTLSEAQKKNFMIFSQHHGIPTCLLDFTRNPLVSLYFACSNDVDCDGYIYIIPNNTIDVTNYIQDITEPSIFLRMITYEKEMQELYYRIRMNISNPEYLLIQLNDYIKNSLYSEIETNALLRYLEELIELYQKYITPTTPKEWFKINNMFSLNQGERRWLKILELLKEIPGSHIEEIQFILDKFMIDETKQDISNLENIYLCTTLAVIIYVIHVNNYGPYADMCMENRKTVFFKQPFNFSITPPNIADRINHQSSVFIYQNYMREHINEFEYFDLLGIQKIVAEYMIKIPKESKKSIMNSLDILGINEQFIYGGYDNIANAIKNRYSK